MSTETFKNIAILITLTLFLLSGISLFSERASAYFYTNLKMGDSGAEVLELQKLLNKDPRTRLAFTGLGSPGQETTYFGSLTKNAVVRFQEIYRSEVLTPVGLYRGSGFVGSQTRSKLNSLLNGQPSDPTIPTQTPTQTSTQTSPVSSSQQTSKPVLHSVSPVSGSDGTEVTLRGEGFLPEGNDVFASFAKLENLPSPDGKTISFVVYEPFPEDLNFPPHLISRIPDFTYGFYIENKNGRSNTLEFRFINSKAREQ